MRCAACGSRGLRRTSRAVVLTGPGKLKPGNVCRGCASTGWLLVFGDVEHASKLHRAKREHVNALAALVDAPLPRTCAAPSRAGDLCELIEGHGGSRHVALKHSGHSTVVVHWEDPT